MNNKYNEVSNRTWLSADYRQLSLDGRYLWLYLLTGPVRNRLPGLYRAGIGACCDDLDWSKEKLLKQFKPLTEKNMALFDWDNSVIYLPKWHRHNRPPANPNVLTAWLNDLDRIPECNYKWAYIKAMIGVVNNCSDGMINDLDLWINYRYDDGLPEEVIIPVKTKVKKVEVINELYIELSEWYHQEIIEIFPNSNHLGNGYIESGAKVLSELNRLDSLNDDDIKKLLDYVISTKDLSPTEFRWIDNLKSLSSLRKKSRSNGLKKYQNIQDSMAKEVKQSVKTMEINYD